MDNFPGGFLLTFSSKLEVLPKRLRVDDTETLLSRYSVSSILPFDNIEADLSFISVTTGVSGSGDLSLCTVEEAKVALLFRSFLSLAFTTASFEIPFLICIISLIERFSFTSLSPSLGYEEDWNREFNFVSTFLSTEDELFSSFFIISDKDILGGGRLKGGWFEAWCVFELNFEGLGRPFNPLLNEEDAAVELLGVLAEWLLAAPLLNGDEVAARELLVLLYGDDEAARELLVLLNGDDEAATELLVLLYGDDEAARELLVLLYGEEVAPIGFSGFL